MTRPTAVRDHAQAPYLRAGPGGLTANAPASKCATCIRPTMAAYADRDTGRSEHRSDHSLALYARTNEYGFIERRTVRCPRARWRRGRLSVGNRRRQVHDRPGERRAGQEGQFHERHRVCAPTTNSCWPSRTSWNTWTFSVAGRVGRGFADPVPGTRRREPRVDGRQHATSGGACLRAEKPLVGTGIERTVAVDSVRPSGMARRPHRLRRCSAYRGACERRRDHCGEVGVDIYNLTKYTVPTRTPTSTSVRWSTWAIRSPAATWWPTVLRRHGRTGSRTELLVAFMRGTLQLRGLDPDLRTRFGAGPFHFDPYRRADHRRSRHQARA